MDLSDIDMGLAALAAQTAPALREPIGTLSPDERVALPHDDAWVESQVSWLYLHLDVARRCRIRMLRPNTSYQVDRRGLELAIARAREIYDELVETGWAPDTLIAQMMIVEGA